VTGHVQSAQLIRGRDSTLETTAKELRAASGLKFTAQLKDLRRCRIFITTVPTPIDEFKRPNLPPLVSASNVIGEVFKRRFRGL
jgi:UDP-N-acetyl-D-galactosamine dehydrogenase